MAAKTNALKVTLPTDTTIKLTREFDAPRELVFEAMSKPEYIKQWWGPYSQPLISVEMDFRVGGSWRFVSKGSDGVEHPFKGVYREIVAPELVEQTWVYDVPPINQYESIERMTLEDLDGRTLFTTIVTHESKEARDGHVNSGMEGGAAETFDRLEELLKKLA